MTAQAVAGPQVGRRRAATSTRFEPPRLPLLLLVLKGWALTALTLGAYRFWASADFRSFMWRHLSLGGERMEYDGRPAQSLTRFLIGMAVAIPVLAAILITVGFNIIDYNGLKEIMKVDRTEGAILLIVLVLTVFVDLITAVGIGMTLSVFVFMKKMGDIGEETIALFPLRSLKVRKPVDLRDEFVLPQEYLDSVYIKSFTGPVFFGFSHFLIENLKRLPSVKIIIFEMNRVPYLDQSAAHALELVFEYMQKRGIRVLLSNLNEQPLRMLRAVDLIPRLIPEHHVFEDIFHCVLSLEAEFVSGKSTP